MYNNPDDHFQRGFMYRKANRKSQNLSSFKKTAEKFTQRINGGNGNLAEMATLSKMFPLSTEISGFPEEQIF